MKVSPVMLFCVSSHHADGKDIHREVCPEHETGRQKMSVPNLTMGLGGGEDAAPLLSTHDLQG